jgi:transcriptional regulator of acetoin/glycerol metabolism
VPSPWVAIDSTSDRRAVARRLARDRDRVLSGGSPGARLRDVILGSWRRSSSAGVDADAGVAPVSVGVDEAAARWAAHPLSAALPEIRALLEDVREEARQVMLFCDRDGTLLWIEGEDAVLDAAQAVNLAPGAVWSEAAAGTNAMGTALALGHPLQVFSAEHFSAAVHQWTCSAAPVRDPSTGEVIGVLDLSGDLGTAAPAQPRGRQRGGQARRGVAAADRARDGHAGASRATSSGAEHLPRPARRMRCACRCWAPNAGA